MESSGRLSGVLLASLMEQHEKQNELQEKQNLVLQQEIQRLKKMSIMRS